MTNFTPLRSIAFAALLNLVLFSLPIHAQDADTPRTQPASESISADLLELAHYRSENTSARELAKVAERLFGRKIKVQRDDVTSESVQNIQLLGDTILIFDEAQRVEQLVRRLSALDAISELDPHLKASEIAPYETINWSPSYVSLRDASVALSSYRRPLPHAANMQNITEVDERNSLILRDEPSNLAGMTKVLAELDTPAPELNVTAIVVQGSNSGSSASDPMLPAELDLHLKQLLPFQFYEVLSLGLVRTSTRVQVVRVSMPGEDDVNYELDLLPEAFDAKTGTLTAEVHFKGSDRRGIQTRTQIPLNEYTVIGASGAQPLLVIIKLSSVSAEAH
ncbi:MAG: hypothetical protein DHS20C15_27900 [Planctomycetota bacterium]|nr:MAG: hypothetical protein DHS20C15_27900 [Planctomycetota bacterium]